MDRTYTSLRARIAGELFAAGKRYISGTEAELRLQWERQAVRKKKNFEIYIYIELNRRKIEMLSCVQNSSRLPSKLKLVPPLCLKGETK